MTARSRRMAFVMDPIERLDIRSDTTFVLMLEAQREGREQDLPPGHVLRDAASLSERFDETHLTGHAAWLDGDWKLHRLIDDEGGARYELYHLADDPRETADESARHPQRVESMTVALDAWMGSVLDSLNGADY